MPGDIDGIREENVRRITQLPAATPLTGSELFEAAQKKDLKKTSVKVRLSKILEYIQLGISENHYTKEEVNEIIEHIISTAGVNGGVFISDINPQGDGNVGSKVFSSDGRVLESCTTDTTLVEVGVIAVTGDTNYKPVVKINDQEVSLVIVEEGPLFTGSVSIDLAGDDHIEIKHEDGASHTVMIEYETKPEILSATFVDEYPGDQTELKAGDTFNLNIETDTDIISIEVDDYGAYESASFSVTSGSVHKITGNIANRGITTQSLGAKVRVQKDTGSWSDWYITSDYGSVDAVHTVYLNNLYPSISINSITYPTGQQALKNSENAHVSNIVNNFDIIEYSSPNNQLIISNNNTYESEKQVTRQSGDYNISESNFNIRAIRSANNAESAASSVIYIAHVPLVVTVTTPAARLRSGGNDGTTAQSHTITIIADQVIMGVPTLVAPAGTWLGSGFSGSGTNRTRSLSVHDDDEKGIYSWGSLSVYNLAGIETTHINSGDKYTLGGFVQRSVILEAFQNEAQMNVSAVDYSKISDTLDWDFKPLPNKRSVGTTATPDSNSWCLDGLGVKPTIIRILDTEAANASSQASMITIQEAV